MREMIRLQPLVATSNFSVEGYEILCKCHHAQQSNSHAVKDCEYTYPSANEILKLLFLDGILSNNKNHVRFFINLSIEDVCNDNFYDDFIRYATGHKIDLRFIVFEISEKTPPSSIHKIKSTLSKLKNHGLRIAIDDFGTHYSNLFLVNELPVDIIKIDATFIKNAVHDKRTMNILKNTINLAHDLSCEAIIEGVETHEQLQCAIDLQADVVQGFLFSSQHFLPTQNTFHFKTVEDQKLSCDSSPFVSLAEFAKHIAA